MGRYAQNLKKIFEKNLRKGHTEAMRFAKEKSIKNKVGSAYELRSAEGRHSKPTRSLCYRRDARMS